MISKNPYDELYEQIDMVNRPFGYSIEYFMWRSSKIKRELAKFIRKNGLIVDVGGGFALMTKFLPDFVDKKNNYVNTDISIEMLKYSPYQNVLAAAERIPFRDSSFDYVIMSEVLEHVRDKVTALNECYRILKKGGLFLLSTPRAGWIEDFRKSPFIVFLWMSSIINSF